MPPEKLTGSAAKQAAKKIAGKAAKKTGKKAGKKGGKSPEREMRRGYEHLHRIHALAGALQGEALEQVQTLALYAQVAFRDASPKSGADLLRAAEHLAFASLGSSSPDEAIAKEVRRELKDELEHLLDRASRDWEAQEPARALRNIYKEARKAAKDAWKSETYGRAMEFARAADALAHAKGDGLKLEGAEMHKLPRPGELVDA